MPKTIRGARSAEFVGLRLPPSMVAWIDEQIRNGEASSRSSYILKVLEIHKDRIEERAANRLVIERSRIIGDKPARSQ
jgi:Arc/MetJ-type ribon-helix-helix transcriptional regulator